MTPNQLLLGAIVAVLAIVVFVPIIRRIVRIVFRIAIVIIPLAAAAGGIAMIMNNETIFEEPGASQRIIRFLTMDSAVASKSGSGTIGCDMKEPPVELQQPSAPGRKRHHHAKTVKAAPPTGSVMPSATPTPDDTYPELIIRGYPGLSRQKLFDLARETVESLGGWKIVSANPATGTLDCVYTSRILKLEDDVRITVDPNGEIGVCSRSGAARPDSSSPLRFIPGDLGANIGHIKQFYEALEPRTDAAYKELQERQNANRPR